MFPVKRKKENQDQQAKKIGISCKLCDKSFPRTIVNITLYCKDCLKSMRFVIRSKQVFDSNIKFTKLNGVKSIQFYCNLRLQEPNHFLRCYKCADDHVEKENITIDKIDLRSTFYILGSFSAFTATNYISPKTKTLADINNSLPSKLIRNISTFVYTEKGKNQMIEKYDTMLYLAENIDRLSEELIDKMENGKWRYYF